MGWAGRGEFTNSSYLYGKAVWCRWVYTIASLHAALHTRVRTSWRLRVPLRTELAGSGAAKMCALSLSYNGGLLYAVQSLVVKQQRLVHPISDLVVKQQQMY